MIKCPQFTYKRHLKQQRKRLTDEADSGPPEETVMDIIYNTFDIPTPLAAPEMYRFKRKKKATDLIVVNPKRIRYLDRKTISQTFSTLNLVKKSQPSFKHLASCKKINSCFSINYTSKSSGGIPHLGDRKKFFRIHFCEILHVQSQKFNLRRKKKDKNIFLQTPADLRLGVGVIVTYLHEIELFLIQKY